MTTPRPAPDSRIAVIQMGGVHEEILPSLIEAIGPGASVDVFVNERCRANRGDIFAETGSFGADIRYLRIAGHGDWRALAETLDGGGYDALVFSTYQRDQLAGWAAERAAPLIGVVHNARLFSQTPKVRAQLAAGRLQVLTLADHVAATLNRITRGRNIDAIDSVCPVVWTDTPSRAGGSERGIAIPGGVSFKNRDFEGLIAALDPARRRALADRGLFFHILGGGRDRAALQDAVDQDGLAELLRLAPLADSGRVVYRDYHAALSAAWSLMPLLPITDARYRDAKITSAIPTGLGFALPMVLDRWTRASYRVPALETDGRLEAMIDALVALSDADHAALAAETRAAADALRRRNRAAMARMIARSIAAGPITRTNDRN